jgi:hypothetical protein
MGWWFGRKSAPADARPCVPGWQTGWLHNDAAEEGFACSREGTVAYVVSTSVWAVFRDGSWEIGSLRGENVVIGGEQVVGARASAIAAPVGGSTVDAEARAAIGQVLSALRAHGLIDS